MKFRSFRSRRSPNDPLAARPFEAATKSNADLGHYLAPPILLWNPPSRGKIPKGVEGTQGGFYGHTVELEGQFAGGRLGADRGLDFDQRERASPGPREVPCEILPVRSAETDRRAATGFH